MENINLVFRIFVLLGFLCALLAELGVPTNQTRAIKITAWAFWFVAALIWAFVLR